MGTKSVRVAAKGSSYQVTWRTGKLSTPKRVVKIPDDIPHYTEHKVRTSALNGTCNDRIRDIALPYPRKIQDTKRQHGKHLDNKKLKNLQTTMETSIATVYSKLGNCDVKSKKPSTYKKNKKWTESDWKKHMAHIEPLATPQKRPLPKRPKTKWKPLQKMTAHINKMSTLPPCKTYRRPSQEDWYKDPLKVSEGALKYEASDRVKELSKPVEIDPNNPHCEIDFY